MLWKIRPAVDDDARAQTGNRKNVTKARETVHERSDVIREAGWDSASVAAAAVVTNISHGVEVYLVLAHAGRMEGREPFVWEGMAEHSLDAQPPRLFLPRLLVAF